MKEIVEDLLWRIDNEKPYKLGELFKLYNDIGVTEGWNKKEMSSCLPCVRKVVEKLRGWLNRFN